MPRIDSPVTLAIIGGIVVGIAIALGFFAWEDESFDAGFPPPRVMTDQNSTIPSSSDGMASSDGSQTTTTEDDATSGSGSASDTAPISPSFDVVRVAPGGSAVIAGRAAPGDTVYIYDGDALIDSVTADSRGEWVFVPEEPLAAGNRQLSLRARDSENRETPSDRVVMIVVPDAEGSDEAIVLSVPADGQGETDVFQKPGGKAPRMLGVDVMDYNEEGEISIAGTTTPNGTVNVYIDNTFFGSALADDDGRWRLTPDARIREGQHELRVDEVDRGGEVINRVAMPFVRAAPDPTLEAGSFYVVQPGNSLWRIARRTYGDGAAYTLIFAANTDQIRDPDLIYPGQIVTLPE